MQNGDKCLPRISPAGHDQMLTTPESHGTF